MSPRELYLLMSFLDSVTYEKFVIHILFDLIFRIFHFFFFPEENSPMCCILRVNVFLQTFRKY